MLFSVILKHDCVMTHEWIGKWVRSFSASLLTQRSLEFSLKTKGHKRPFAHQTADHSPAKPPKMNKSVVTILIILVVTTSSSASPFRYRTHTNHVNHDDYDDFSEVPKFLRYVYNLPDTVKDEALEDILLPSPKKRYRKIHDTGCPSKFWTPCTFFDYRF